MESRRLDLLIVEPPLLTFYAPYTRIQRRLLTLLNPTAGKVLFKVRSNASRHYSVSPNCGYIDAYATSEINIGLNYFDFHPNRLYRHRFCIQSSVSPMENITQVEDLLSLFQNIPRSEIYSVRVPILLHGFEMASQMRLNNLTIYKSSAKMNERFELRALCPNCVDNLKNAKRKRIRRRIFKVLFMMGIVVGGLSLAYVLRHQIYEFIKMQTQDDLEL